jgi:hypothetical protein
MRAGAALETGQDLEAARAAYAGRLFHIHLELTPAYQSDGAFLAWLRDWLGSPLSIWRRRVLAAREIGRWLPTAGYRKLGGAGAANPFTTRPLN